MIPPGIQRACGLLPIISDSAIEPDEFYTVCIDTLETVQNGCATIIIKNVNGMRVLANTIDEYDRVHICLFSGSHNFGERQ